MNLVTRALLTLILLPPGAGMAQNAEPVVVPRIWDAARLRDWALPLAGLGEPPGFLSPERYYALPVDDLRTYPVYHPAREPKGYRDELLRKGPQPLIEPERLHTRADWLAAGQRVFDELDTYLTRTDDPAVLAHLIDAAAVDRYRDASHDAMDANGILLDYRWVVDRDRKLKLSVSSCVGCHSRLMPDGSVLAGAPCNYDLSDAPVVARLLAPLVAVPGMTPGELAYMSFGVPWREHDEHSRFRTMSGEDMGTLLHQPDGAPTGTTFNRFNGSPSYTTRMADLRGLADRRYLDATGTHRNREPADVARYAILVEFADVGVFGPHQMVPAAALALQQRRPSDAAVFAMALYLYSLEVPPSPHLLDEQARRGAAIFADEGCKKCHPPPLYSNNALLPVTDFTPPKVDARTAQLTIMDRTIDTDSGLALRTRKGTGYYRVPSLRGLWYRGLFEHSGSVASLEDWFDARRLEADYVPSGWRGPGVGKRAVPGHEFGLDLEPADKAALIAFLRTL